MTIDRNLGITNTHLTGIRRELVTYSGGWKQSATEVRGRSSMSDFCGEGKVKYSPGGSFNLPIKS